MPFLRHRSNWIFSSKRRKVAILCGLLAFFMCIFSKLYNWRYFRYSYERYQQAKKIFQKNSKFWYSNCEFFGK